VLRRVLACPGVAASSRVCLIRQDRTAGLCGDCEPHGSQRRTVTRTLRVRSKQKVHALIASERWEEQAGHSRIVRPGWLARAVSVSRVGLPRLIADLPCFACPPGRGRSPRSFSAPLPGFVFCSPMAYSWNRARRTCSLSMITQSQAVGNGEAIKLPDCDPMREAKAFFLLRAVLQPKKFVCSRFFQSIFAQPWMTLMSIARRVGPSAPKLS
jgi:hypothetical protein